MESRYKLRNRVRELRARLNLRQADLAREVAVTRQTILAIEKGRLNPSVLLSLKIARVLREPVDYIFYLDRPAGGEPEGDEQAIAASMRNRVHTGHRAMDDELEPRAVYEFG